MERTLRKWYGKLEYSEIQEATVDKMFSHLRDDFDGHTNFLIMKKPLQPWPFQ